MPEAKKTEKPTKKAEHPTFAVMVAAAIEALKEKKGSSRQAIEKYICANYRVGPKYAGPMKMALKKGVESGKLEQVRGVGAAGSFKLAKVDPEKKAAKKPVKPQKKDLGAPKAKTGTKKPAKLPTTPKKPAPKKVTKKTPTKKAAPKKAAVKAVKAATKTASKAPATPKKAPKSPVKKATKKAASPKKAAKAPKVATKVAAKKATKVVKKAAPGKKTAKKTAKK